MPDKTPEHHHPTTIDDGPALTNAEIRERILRIAFNGDRERFELFLQTIRDWGKKIVIVVNKVDIFTSDAELEQVMRFVRDSAARLLGITPDVFPVSARLATRAKRGEPAVWPASRFGPLEDYILHTLDDETRFKLKLANPLGVGEALAGRYATIAGERLELLREDLTRLAMMMPVASAAAVDAAIVTSVPSPSAETPAAAAAVTAVRA